MFQFVALLNKTQVLLGALMPTIPKFTLGAQIRPVAGMSYVVVATLIYLALFAFLYPVLGFAEAFAAIPVIVAGFSFGFRGGLIAGILCLPFDMGLFWYVARESWIILLQTSIVVHIMIVGLGAFIGRLRDLQIQLAERLIEREHMALALEKSEAHWRSVLTYEPDVVMTVNRKGIIQYMNHSEGGYSSDDVVGYKLTDFAPESEQQTIVRSLERVFDQGEPTEHDMELEQRYGGVAYYRNRYAPLRDADSVVGAIVVRTNVSELRRLQAARTKFLEKIVSAQEDERGRIARELHDVTGQSLTSLLIGLRVLDELDDIDEIRLQARDLRSMTSALIKEIGRLARGLRPSVLDDVGLAAALVRYSSEFGRLHSLLVDVELVGFKSDTRVPAPIEVTLYRIAQEALTNVARHAQATTVSLIFERQKNSVRAIIEDDGRGFVIDSSTGLPETCNGLGLLGMRERAELVGGSLMLESNIGSGTTIYARLPLTT